MSEDAPPAAPAHAAALAHASVTAAATAARPAYPAHPAAPAYPAAPAARPAHPAAPAAYPAAPAARLAHPVAPAAYPAAPVARPARTVQNVVPASGTVERREASPARSHASRRSLTTTEARVRAAQLAAAEQIAELKKRQLQIEEELIMKRLTATVETIREEEAGSMADPDERIDTWLQQNANVPVSTEVNTPGHTTSAFAPPAQEPCIERGERQQYGKLPESVHFEETRRRVLSPTPIRQRGDIEQLAEAIEKMARNRPAPRQVIDLPIFTGAFNEWLPFAAAYKESSTAYNFTDVENLARLRNCLRGEAKEAVAELLCTGGSPEQVMRTLEQCFGRPEFIIDKVLDDIKKLPRLGNSARELNTFAVRLQNIVCALKNLGRRGYMEYPMLTRDILEKLTPHLKSRWCDYAHEHDHPSVPEIMVLSRFLMREAELALRYTYAPATTTTVAAKPTATWKSAPRKNKADVYATTASAPNDQYKCYKCEGNHTLVNCDQFKKMNTDERWEVVKNAGLCFKCIVSRHRRMNCRAKPCGENECRRPHHKLLHADPTPTPSSPTVSAPKVVTNETVMSVAAADAEKDAAVLLKVLPVTLTGPKRQIQAHALLDEGATISLIEEELAQQLGVRGPSRPLQINGVTACQRHTRSEAVKISIRGRSQRECHEIKLRTIPQLVLHTQAIPAGILNYEHLRDLDPGNVCYESTRPRLLIGADNWHLIVSRELRTGKKTEPVASRTELGWTVHGTVPRALHRTSEESVLHVS
ncbi:hypothetical protein ABMA28_008938 [Loxostege sticticalis]|uniref:Peptidase A2 domain-containing protein n=1 Tax=Loxostege sticticalis TaxID=481309 RepID=A0ABD0SHF4_LOXSC